MTFEVTVAEVAKPPNYLKELLSLIKDNKDDVKESLSEAVEKLLKDEEAAE